MKLPSHISQRGKEILKDFVETWGSRVPSKTLMTYKNRHLLNDTGLCDLILGGILAILIVGLLVTIVVVFFNAFTTTLLDQRGVQRDASVMAFIFTYISILGHIVYYKAFVKKSIPEPDIRIFPIPELDLNSDQKITNIKKYAQKYLYLGCLATLIVSFLVYYSAENCWGLITRSLLAYCSFVALSISTTVVIRRVSIIYVPIILSIIFVSFSGLIGLDKPKVLEFLDSYLEFIPSYWFINSEMSSLHPVQWCILIMILLAGLLLWKPLWNYIYSRARKETESQKNRKSDKQEYYSTEEIRNKLKKQELKETLFPSYFLGGLKWFLILNILGFVCLHQSTSANDIPRIILTQSAVSMIACSYIIISIILFADYIIAVCSTVKTSQSRQALEIGLFPLETHSFLKSLVARSLIKIFIISILGGSNFLLINYYTNLAFFRDMSFINSFFIGALLFSFSGIIFCFSQLSESYKLRDSHNLKTIALSWLMQILSIVLFFLPLVASYLIFNRTEEPTTSRTWIIFSIISGILLIITTIWVIYNHRKKVLTLTQ